jgi:replicative DNA helicase
MALVEAAGTRCKNWKLHLMDVADLTVHVLRSVVKRHHLESNGQLRLVVLDYLQLLRSTKADASEYERVSEISRILKLMAMELKLPVLALSQMSRDSEKGASSQPRDPRLSDLRGSGSIEQDADAVLFIHRTDGGEGSEDEVRRLKIIVAKNRFGRTGFMPLDFYPERLRFIPSQLDEEPGEDDGSGPARGHLKRQRRRVQDQPGAEEDHFASDGDAGGQQRPADPSSSIF